jgi:MFS family permease
MGRRATLLVALLCGATAMLGVGFAERPALVAALVFLLGLTTDLQRPATAAMIADVVAPEHRLRAYGLQHWAVNIGFSVAPVLAGLAAGLSYRLLFIVDAATSLAYALLVLVKLREPEAASRPRAPVLSGLATVARDGRFMVFAFLTFLVGMVYSQVAVALPIDAGAHGIPPSGYGTIVALNGVLIVLLSPGVARRLSSLPRGPVLAVAALLTGAGFALHAPAATVAGYMAGVVLWTLGEIASAPASSALVADRAPAALRGRYQGMFIMSWGAAAFAGPWLGSLVLDRFGADALWLACGAVGLIAAAGFWILAGDMGVPSAARR